MQRTFHRCNSRHCLEEMNLSPKTRQNTYKEGEGGVPEVHSERRSRVLCVESEIVWRLQLIWWPCGRVRGSDIVDEGHNCPFEQDISRVEVWTWSSQLVLQLEHSKSGIYRIIGQVGSRNEDREVAIAVVLGGECSDDDNVFLLVGFSRMMGFASRFRV